MSRSVKKRTGRVMSSLLLLCFLFLRDQAGGAMLIFTDAWSLESCVSRRNALWTGASSMVPLYNIDSAKAATPHAVVPREAKLRLNYVYSSTWTGTALPLRTLGQAVADTNLHATWKMGRWPDPILRRPASPVSCDYFGTETLKTACAVLQKTAIEHHAVGLAAQQCGVDARLVYIEQPTRRVLVNPRILHRSDESRMRVWREECLVVPPTFRGTVLRDACVTVEYEDWEGSRQCVRLNSEAARCLQHELDHDTGILILDHVSLEEMENDDMRAMERQGHDDRMQLAYARNVEDKVEW